MKKIEELYVHGIPVDEKIVEFLQKRMLETQHAILSIKIGNCGYMHLLSDEFGNSDNHEDVASRVFLHALEFTVRSEGPIKTFAVKVRSTLDPMNGGRSWTRHFTIRLDETEMARLSLELLGRPGAVRDLPHHEMNIALERVQCEDAEAANV